MSGTAAVAAASRRCSEPTGPCCDLASGRRHPSFIACDAVLLQNPGISGSVAVAPLYRCSGREQGTGWECCWQIFLGSAFFATKTCVLSAYSVEVFCVALPLQPWILFL